MTSVESTCAFLPEEDTNAINVRGCQEIASRREGNARSDAWRLESIYQPTCRYIECPNS